MSHKALTVLGISMFGLGSVFAAAPAQAAVSDCGTAPTGGTLTWVETPGVCELTFSAAGTYNWTPSEIADLQGLIVGAGGGAYVASGPNGYAGNGGEVQYMDLSQLPSVSPFTIIVGAGGTTSDSPTAGGLTSVDFGLGTPTAAGGGVGSISNGYCALNGSYSTYLGMGNGAGGNATEGSGGICGTAGAGVTLFAGNHDSSGNPVNSLFTNYIGTFGLGGNLTANGSVDGVAPGQGANLAINLSTDTLTAQTNGGNGLAVFRWTPTQIAPPANGGTTPSETLASTGSNDFLTLWLAAASLALGFGLVKLTPRGNRKNR